MKAFSLWLTLWLTVVSLCWAAIFPAVAQNDGALLDESYYVEAYKPHDPDKVTVQVSLRNQAVYVREGERILLVAACTVGTADTPTPTGEFTILRKEKKKRRHQDPGHGYPMGYWCEFKEGYAIHAGWVHRRPRTNGTIRLHHNVAPKFFELVQLGTPLSISTSLPEDETIGRDLAWPGDSQFPELPLDVLNSDRVFELYRGPIWEADESGRENAYHQAPDHDGDEASASDTSPGESSAAAPFGIPVRGKANIILSPYAKDQGYIDVEGLSSGTEIFCPWTKKVIRVP